MSGLIGLLLFAMLASPAEATTNNVLYSWGDNTAGQLGDGSTTSQAVPEAITLAQGVTPEVVACGYLDDLAIGSDDNLYTWGSNAVGQLGDGTTSDRSTPEAIALAPGVHPTAISAGSYDAFAIGSNGLIYSWGDNEDGELGNGNKVAQTRPIAISLGVGISASAISASPYGTMAIGSDGRIYEWGSFYQSQQSTPSAITLAPGVSATAISDGGTDALAVGSNGELYAWGGNQQGELGDGTTTSEDSPEVIELAPGVLPTAIAAGYHFSIAIGTDGNVYTWGSGVYTGISELGDGSQGRLSPEPITLSSGKDANAIGSNSGVAGVNVALATDGSIYAWGDGDLGDGQTAGSSTPQPVSLPTGMSATSVAAGGVNSLAIGSAAPASSLPEAPLTASIPVLGSALLGYAWMRGHRNRRKPAGAFSVTSR